MIDEDIEMTKKWLKSRGVTLWQSWDLNQASSLDEAARWFVDQQRQYRNWRISQASKYAPNAEFDVV